MTSRPAPPISAPAAAAWRAYRDVLQARRPRSEARAAMDAFLAALAPEDRGPFTAWFFRALYEHGEPLAGQGSLARVAAHGVLVPELLAGVRAGRVDHLRWLALALMDQRFDVERVAPDLGRISWEQALLALALARNPDAAGLWWATFWRELADASYAGHEMHDGGLLLPHDECRMILRSARQLAAAAPPGAIGDEDREELADLEACYAAFFAWHAAGRPGRYAGPVPRWLSRRMPPRPTSPRARR